jgi:hypothetical protein
LQNLRNLSARLPTFEANRYQQIRDRSPVQNWHYVPTDPNPADIASRGLKTSETDKVETWKNGAEFLKLKEEFWPKEPPGLGQLPPYYDHIDVQKSLSTKHERNTCVDSGVTHEHMR